MTYVSLQGNTTMSFQTLSLHWQTVLDTLCQQHIDAVICLIFVENNNLLPKLNSKVKIFNVKSYNTGSCIDEVKTLPCWEELG